MYLYESLTNTSESSDSAFEQKGVQNNENIFEKKVQPLLIVWIICRPSKGIVFLIGTLFKIISREFLKTN